MKNYWRTRENPPEDFFNSYPEYSKVTCQLLYNRNLKDEKEILRFFNPNYETDINDPFSFHDMKKAVERVKSAIAEKERIAIWGDYDADGVSGASLLYSLFRKLGMKEYLDVYIPDRNKEGYGVNMKGVSELAERKTKLIITVDCGLSNHEEIRKAKKLGIDIIICDHHLTPEVNPPAYAVINPKAKDSGYSFPHLSGTGVAFKFASAILQSYSPEFLETYGIKKGFEKWFLDLVAIATVADRMSLTLENRMLVKYGLIVMAQTRRLGLRMLLIRAGIIPWFDFSNLATNLTTQDLSFTVIPRINAMGRLSHASTSFELLTTESDEEAKWLAKTIEAKNMERIKMVDEAMLMLGGRIKPDDGLIFQAFDDGTLPGILSVLSTKISEKYSRPAFILAEQKEKSFGSARSYNLFNCVEALASAKDLLLGYGGHPFAAGFSILNEHIPEFKKRMETFVHQALRGEGTPREEILIDKEIVFDEVTLDLYEDIQKFEPFGEANWTPKFLVRNMRAMDYKFVGNGEKHIKFVLANMEGDARKTLSAMGFFLGSKMKHLEKGNLVDLVFELQIDRYNGNRKLSLKIIDFDVVGE